MTPPRFPYAVAVLLALAAISLAPVTPASAALSHRAQIERIFHVLNLLPDQVSSSSRVARLVTRLVAFDPDKAKKYYKAGLNKLQVGIDPGWLEQRVIATLKKSGLPFFQIKQIIKSFTPPTEPGPPTGPPPLDGP